MTLTLYPDLVQGSEEWLTARTGIVTASTVGQLITPTLKVAANETSRGLTATLVAERITGHVDPGYMSNDMWRGIEDEPFARDAYSTHVGKPVAEVGLMVREVVAGVRIGYSPDGLVGKTGLIECKSRAPKKHVQTVLADAVPAENMAQIQCGLLVSGRKWCDYVSFCGGMRLWVTRVTPDMAWFLAILNAVKAFEQNATEMRATYEKAVKGFPMTERTPDYAELEVA